MPDLGPMGRGGARRRTRRRMSAVNEAQKSEEPTDAPGNANKLEKLARLLVDKGVITEEEYNLIFN